jgi:eukaryotic-like serine/threonine-protein kinase
MRIAGERGFDLNGSGAAPLAPDDPPQIGPFPLVGVLGSGGMGRVYLGAAPGRYTAVKQVLPALADDQDFLRHFGHELDNLAKLPAGVSAQLLATDRTARPPWFATEYIPGLTLSDAVELHGGSLPSSALWLLLRETASCLRAVHARETVHRDLKPSNVMLTRDGLTLIDFGIARAVDQSRVTKTGMVVGTPAYMAPEQATGVPQLTAAADVFSLGCLLVYAATGRPPFGGGAGLDLLYRIVHDDADLEAVRNVDAALATVLESCLAKDPAARPTAADLLELAQNHLVHASPAWPQVVTARIREREAFAATAPQRQEASASAPAVRTPIMAGPEPVLPQADLAARAPRKRRQRMLLIVLPIVLVAAGTTATIALAPYGSARGAAPSASPSGAAFAGGYPHTTSVQTSQSGTMDLVQGTASGSSGAQIGSGKAGAPDASTSGSAGADASKTGASPTAAGSPAVVSTAAGLLKNVARATCLDDQGGAYTTSLDTCSSAASQGWIAKYVTDTTFELVNKGSGKCLTSGSGYATMYPCGSLPSVQHWQIGTRTAQGGTIENINGGCLAWVTNHVTTTGCNPGDTQQIWANAGTV